MLQFLHCFLYTIGLLTKGLVLVFFPVVFLNDEHYEVPDSSVVGSVVPSKLATGEQGLLEPAQTYWVQQMQPGLQ